MRYPVPAHVVEALVRQAEADRNRYVAELFARGMHAVAHLGLRAAHAVLDYIPSADGDEAYLNRAVNHADLKRRYLILEREHSHVSLDVGR